MITFFTTLGAIVALILGITVSLTFLCGMFLLFASFLEWVSAKADAWSTRQHGR